MNRQEKLDELFAWAKGQPLTGIESRVFQEALRRYRCTYATAHSYALTVRMMLQEAQKPIATVQQTA